MQRGGRDEVAAAAARPAQDAPVLELRGVRKRFGGVLALDGVDFELRAGEVHALLGENGAGKSTLIKIIGGIHQPDSGELRVDGAPVVVRQVADADRLGIRLIHQELTLAPNLSIAENLFLGREPRWRGLLLDRSRLVKDAQALVTELGLPEIRDVRARVATLNVARQQLVEIARALSARARVLVLDEPTAALSEAETAVLFQRLERLRSQGVGIIYISHRLEEIGRLADRVTVLRDGRSVGTQSAAALDRRTLVQWMVGRGLKDHYPRPSNRPGAPILEVRELEAPRVNRVSFQLRAGEVLGLVGLVGAGRSTLARCLYGLTPATGGLISIAGSAVRVASPADARAAGIAFVPEDRKREGLVMGESVGFNIALPWTHEWLRWCFPDWARRNGIIERVTRDFGVQMRSPAQPVATLSGGNQQKVVVGRCMERPPRVLILDEPTRGVDVGAREEMFAIIHRLVATGMGVVLISSDLPEVMNLSHRLVLYRDGAILRELEAGEWPASHIMAALTGEE
jgi:ABC-type sugar transport system ATPase subunit